MMKFARFCDGVLEAGWLAAVLLVPLFFNKASELPFEMAKAGLLWLIALIMAMAWGARWLLTSPAALRQPSRSLSRKPMGAVALLLALVLVLSTACSLVPFESFFGYSVRAHGALTTLCILVVFATVSQALRTPMQFERLLAALIVPSAPICLYALAQRFGWDPIVIAESETAIERVTSTLGHPVFLGAYLALVVPFTVLTWRWALKGGQRARARGAAVLVALQLVTMVLTESRGPLLGLGAGAVVALFASLATQVKARQKRLRGVAVLVLGLVFSVSAALAAPKFDFENRMLRRLSQAFAPEGGSGRFRSLTGEVAARVFLRSDPVVRVDSGSDKMRPLRWLVGYGPEMQYVVSPPMYLPQVATVAGTYFVVDRFHNDLWDRLIATGVLGLATQVAVQVAFVLTLLGALGVLRSRKEFAVAAAVILAMGALAGAVLAFVLGRGLLFLGAELGMLLGLVGLLAAAATRRDAREPPIGSGLAMACLSAGVAHFFETSLSFTVVATGLLFWVTAALAQRPGLEAPATAPKKGPPDFPWAGLGLLVAMVAILGFDFLRPGAVAAAVAGVALLAGGLFFTETDQRRRLFFASAALALPVILLWSNQSSRLALPGTVEELVGRRMTLTLLVYSVVAATLVFVARAVSSAGEAPKTVPLGVARKAGLAAVVLLGLWFVMSLMLPRVYGRLAGRVAETAMSSGKFEMAARARLEAIRAEPSENSHHTERGRALLHLAGVQSPQSVEHFEEAERELKEAIRLQPYRGANVANLAMLYAAWIPRVAGPLRPPLVEKMEDAYRRSLLAHPFDPELRAAWAAAQLGRLGDEEAAAASAKRALEISPKTFRANLVLGDIWGRKARRAEEPARREAWLQAIQHYTQAVEIDLTQAQPHAALVEALWSAGDRDAARAALTRARASVSKAKAGPLDRVQALLSQ